MKNRTSNQKTDFVESLYKQLREQTKNAINEQKHFIESASDYLEDGLSEQECVELLIIDGAKRDEALNYIAMSKNNIGSDETEYAFQFEDSFGKTYSSFDMGLQVFASTEQEAWEKAEEEVFNIDAERVISVTRL
jgi:hypothetical protein